MKLVTAIIQKRADKATVHIFIYQLCWILAPPNSSLAKKILFVVNNVIWTAHS